MYYDNRDPVDAVPMHGDPNSMCYDPSGNGCATVASTQQAEVEQNNKSTVTGHMEFNIHLHPGRDPASRTFSGRDISLSVRQNIPVFIGNKNGDVSVYLPQMGMSLNAIRTGGDEGIELCHGCAK